MFVYLTITLVIIFFSYIRLAVEKQETAKCCCERYGVNNDVVGRWLAAAEGINEYITVIGCN